MEIDIQKDKEFVTVIATVEHIRGTKKSKKEFKTSDILLRLERWGYNVEDYKVLEETRIFNYQTLKRCSGIWKFLDQSKTKVDKPEVKIELLTAMVESLPEIDIEADTKVDNVLNKKRSKRTRKPKEE